MYTSVHFQRKSKSIREIALIYTDPVAGGIWETIKHLEEAGKFRVKSDADSSRIDFQATAAIYIRAGRTYTRVMNSPVSFELLFSN